MKLLFLVPILISSINIPFMMDGSVMNGVAFGFGLGCGATMLIIDLMEAN